VPKLDMQLHRGSAVFGSFMALLKAAIICFPAVHYLGSTHNIITKYLSKYGIEYSYMDASANIDEWKRISSLIRE
jgi:O-succinylhomoserine sulfhydrylase